jgi:nicotinamidase-related amidase
MPLDTIARREDAVLIVVDLQERLTAVMERREPVLSAVVRLIRVATLVGMPIVVTRQYPKGLGETEPVLVEALEVARNEGAIITHADKTTFDCFRETSFAEPLAAAGRSQLIIAGMETHICVTQTALAALREGLDVHVVADGCCSRDSANHDLALGRIRSAGGVVTVTESVMYELVGAAATDEFRALLGIVKG